MSTSPRSKSGTLEIPELNLGMTLNSGQAFHWTAFDDGWTGCIGDKAVFLRQRGQSLEYRGIGMEQLGHYLALDHDLEGIRASCDHPVVREASLGCRGLRILRQPRWECLATFILSPMKQVAHIRQMSLALRERFGTSLAGTPVPAFPSASALAAATEQELRACGLGFRAKGLLGTARLVASGEFDPDALTTLSTEEARDALCSLPGIGRKVANCILLFAYERLEVVPVDVWIGRILGSFRGRKKASPAELERYGERVLGPYAGYVQQWLFHRARDGPFGAPFPKVPETHSNGSPRHPFPSENPQISHRMRKELTKTETRMEKAAKRRQRFPFYLLLSCLIHATLIILLAIVFARNFVRTEKSVPPPEVTLIIPPPSPTDRPTVTATEVTDKPPENAPFQSDQNSKAASELPPEGNLPLPTQQGVSLPALELQNQKHTAGEKPATQAGNPAQPQQASPGIPPSLQKPAQKQPEKSASPTPSPQATPSPTPTSTPPPNNLKLLQPPDSSLRQPSKPNQSAPTTPATASSAPGSAGATKGYQPETRQTVIRGNISNRGRSSVAAEATPIGRYKKAVADAIGSRWYYYVDERMGLLSIGTVDVNFKVSASGKVTGLRVVRSNGNESLTDCSLRSIMDAKLPPIPPDVVPTIQNGCLEIDYSFTIY